MLSHFIREAAKKVIFFNGRAINALPLPPLPPENNGRLIFQKEKGKKIVFLNGWPFNPPPLLMGPLNKMRLPLNT